MGRKSKVAQAEDAALLDQIAEVGRQDAAEAAFAEGFAGISSDRGAPSAEAPEKIADDLSDRENIVSTEEVSAEQVPPSDSEPVNAPPVEVAAPQSATLQQLQDRVRSTEAVLGELASRVRRMQRAKAAPIETERPLKDPAKWVEVRKEWAELAEGTEEKLAHEEQRWTSKIRQEYVAREEFDQLVDEAIKERLRQAEIAREAQKIQKELPGWKEEMVSPEFMQWLRVQDRGALARYESDYADDLISLHREYTAWATRGQRVGTPPGQSRNERLAKAVQPAVRSAAPPTQYAESAEEAFNSEFTRVSRGG